MPVAADPSAEEAADTADLALQDRYAPHSICFGCGPANAGGLRIKSRVTTDADGATVVVADWQGGKVHEAFEGMLNGGIIGALLDCHCNWTAAHHLMVRTGAAEPPCTVTAEYHIKLLRPTPSAGPVHLVAHVTDASDRRANVHGELFDTAGELCATCDGVFVAVREGHPAWHRW